MKITKKEILEAVNTLKKKKNLLKYSEYLGFIYSKKHDAIVMITKKTTNQKMEKLFGVNYSIDDLEKDLKNENKNPKNNKT